MGSGTRVNACPEAKACVRIDFVAITPAGDYSVMEGPPSGGDAALILDTQDPDAAVMVVCGRLDL